MEGKVAIGASAAGCFAGRANKFRAKGVVLGAGLNLFMGTGQVLLFSFGVFVKPIIANTGWSRSQISGAVLWGQLLIALAAPLTGLAVDHFGARRVARFAGPSLGLGVMLTGLLADSAGSFVFLFALSFLLGAAQVPVPYVKAVSNWYQKRLGLALGSAMILSGAGVALIPPLSAALIDAFGWRMAYVALAVIVWVVSIPSVAFLLHEPPPEAATTDRNARQAETVAMSGMTLARAMRTRPFWLIAISFYLISVAVGAGTHVLPIVLSDAGVKAQQGSLVMTIVGVAMMVARFGFGALLDRFHAPRLTALVFTGAAIGFLCLASGLCATTVAAAAVLIGLALGAEVDALAYLASRAFGRRHLGAVYGALMFCFSFGLGCGPALFGQVFKHTGSYRDAFWLAVMLATVAALAILAVRRGDLKSSANGTPE
ncbi:MFS transporter [Paraburkholderia strydomiana]|uniref:MFS transporter n=1 Tax=Paraburkholderia strydomiana TaxID=1245417 RepID=UPI002035362C|nr:MFS transporter [Paraburkholderia strydomiana]